jgi:hypothetical protein
MEGPEFDPKQCKKKRKRKEYQKVTINPMS